MSRWWIRIRGREMGPFSHEEVLEMRATGQLQDFHDISEHRRTWMSVDDWNRSRPLQCKDPFPVAPPTPVGNYQSIFGVKLTQFKVMVASIVVLIGVGSLTTLILVLRKSPSEIAVTRKPDEKADSNLTKFPESVAPTKEKKIPTKVNAPTKITPSPKPILPPAEDPAVGQRRRDLAAAEQSVREWEETIRSLKTQLLKAAEDVAKAKINTDRAPEGSFEERLSILAGIAAGIEATRLASQLDDALSKLRAARNRVNQLRY